MGIYIGIAALLLVIVVSSKNTPNTNSTAQKATYAAEVRDYSVVNPSTLRVDVKVHNTGSVSGKPTCHIQAGKPTDAYHGFDGVTHSEELKPGQWWGFSQNITVSKEGAGYVESVTVECK